MAAETAASYRLTMIDNRMSRVLASWASTGFVVGLLVVRLIHAVDAAAPQQAAQQTTRVFAHDAGLVLNFIKPDKTADFEAVMGRLKEALNRSDKPERRQQAEGWRIFRAIEPGPNGSVLYVFAIDPAVKGADYTVSNVLAEAFPQEVQALYKQYAESYASGQNIVNLMRVQGAVAITP
jgi:hypothetical protein